LILKTIYDFSSRYEIRTLWDGTPLKHTRPPAVVELNADPSGGLRVSVSAAFFNSPHPNEPFNQKCPEKPYFGLWNYEVGKLYGTVES